MNIAQQIENIILPATTFVQTFFPDIPAEVIRYGGAGLLIGLALLMLFKAVRIFHATHAPQNGKRVNIPRTLQKAGSVIDILNKGQDVAVRCVITAASSGKIKCEIIERLTVITTKEGNDIMGVFAPIQTEQGRINTFTARLMESDRSGRRPDRIVLSIPTDYAMLPRRKHSRKRVADQQFIRVKLWITDPYTSDISFEDAAAHIGVNSFATDGPDQSANTVVNISNGGLGLNVQNHVIPETCGVGAQVTINLFMFNFQEKSFKPYWYAGEIRSMKEGRPGFTRIGIQFNGTGSDTTESGHITWETF